MARYRDVAPSTTKWRHLKSVAGGGRTGCVSNGVARPNSKGFTAGIAFTALHAWKVDASMVGKSMMCGIVVSVFDPTLGRM